MKEIQLKKKNWDEITINDYKRIVEICQDEYDTVTEKNIEVLAVLCDVDSDTMWDMPVIELQDMIQSLSFLNEFDFDKKKKYKKLKIDDLELVCDCKVSKMSVAQYVDFQAFWIRSNTDLARMISVFYVPQGCKYNEGYDIDDVVEKIENNVSIAMANSICFFLLKKLVNSIHSLVTYCKLMMKMMKWKMDKREARKKIEELEKQIDNLNSTFIYGIRL